MSRMEIKGMSQSKFKKIGKADFNMAVLYFTLLSDIMKDMASVGVEAECSLKGSDIIRYYSSVKQYYITLSPFIHPKDENSIDKIIKNVDKNINVPTKTVTDAVNVIIDLQNLQIVLYNIAQQRRLLVPMSTSGSSIGDIERKFGLKK